MNKKQDMDKELPRVCRDLEAGKINSKDLFKKSSELIIIHDDQEYRMRITGGRKLILTK